MKSYGQLLQTEAKRLGEMVERVLQYAGIESGLGFATRVALPPSEIIDGAIDSSLPLLESSDVQVHREIAADLPPVMGDAAALRSVVQNLIANAVKYGGRDRWVGIRAEHAVDRRRSEVRITVSDHGVGIPPRSCRTSSIRSIAVPTPSSARFTAMVSASRWSSASSRHMAAA